MYQKNPLILFESYGEILINENDIDFSKVKILEKYKDLIEKLDKWVLFADNRLLPDLLKLSKIVDSLYHFKMCKIYRGFNTNGIQDKMNLVEKGFFGNKIKENIKLGYKFKYETSRPISFSSDLNIAKYFGNIVIETMLPKNKLVLTNEICYIISKQCRKLKECYSQKEVIVFPNQELSCKVIRL